MTAGAELSVVPAVSLGAEYDDNVFLSRSNAVHEYITHAIPALSARYAAPVWDWTLAYAYDYRSYAYKSYADEGVQKLSLKSTVRLVKDLLFFDVRDDADRTSISAVRDYAQDSPLKNQTDYNALELKPYASLALSTRTTLTAGYSHRTIAYKDPDAIDHTTETLYGNIDQKVTDRAGLAVSGRIDRTVATLLRRTRTGYLLGTWYEYQQQSTLWGKIGASRTSYDGGRTETRPTWDAGIAHRTASASLSYETGRTWIEDPYLSEQREDRYVATLKTEHQRTTAGLSVALRNYGDDQNTTEQKYTIDADISHFLTEHLRARVALNNDRYKRTSVDNSISRTTVYHAEVLFEQHITESFIVTMSYRYAESHSLDTESDNYRVNRVYLEAKQSF